MDDIAKELITAANSSDFRSYPKEEALCDSCLGRLFGRVGTGFTNAERGKIIRESFDVHREGPCSLCSGLMDEIPKFARLVESALSEFEFDTFLIGSFAERTRCSGSVSPRASASSTPSARSVGGGCVSETVTSADVCHKVSLSSPASTVDSGRTG